MSMGGVGESLRNDNDPQGISTYQLPGDTVSEALVQLWQDRHFCDMELQGLDGARLPAHRLVLAAGSGYFRALFTGPGSEMRDASSGLLQYPQYTHEHLQALLRVLYERKVQVCPSSVPWLLELGSYFQVPQLVKVCSEYLRSMLGLHSCVDLLLLAHQHHALQLRKDVMMYLCRRLPALLSDASAGARLGCLPLQLLLELLASEDLAVDSELDVLHVIRHWVTRDPVTRSRHLPQLLSLVSVSELPAGLPLSAHLPVTQLGSSPEARSAISTLSALVNTKDQALALTQKQQQQQQKLEGGGSSSSSSGGSLKPLQPLLAAAAGAGALLRVTQGEQQHRHEPHGAGSGIFQVGSQWHDEQQQQLVSEAPWFSTGPPQHQNHQQQQQESGENGLSLLHLPPYHHQHHQPQQQPHGSPPDAYVTTEADQCTAVAGATPSATAVLVTTTTTTTAAAAAVARPSTSSSNLQTSCSSSVLADTPMLDASGSSHSYSYTDSPLWCSTSSSNNLFTDPATTTNGGHGCDGSDFGLIGGFGAWGTAPRRRSHRPTRLLVAGGHDLSWRSLSFAEVLDPLEGLWAPVAALPAAMSFAGAALLDRSVYVVEGAMFSSIVARYDPGADAWSSCPGLNIPRLHAAVAAAAGCLFAMGGRSQVNQVLTSLESYSPGSDSWQVLAPMATPRYALAAAAVAGVVYAVGGQASKRIQRTVESFNPETGTWSQLSAQLTVERKYCGAAAMSGRLLVVGGMTDARTRVAAVDAYDPREGRWTALPAMQVARSSCGVGALGDQLYVLGGNADDHSLHSSVEIYDAAAGRWRPGSPLSYGRSGLCVAPM